MNCKHCNSSTNIKESIYGGGDYINVCPRCEWESPDPNECDHKNVDSQRECKECGKKIVQDLLPTFDELCKEETK